MKQAKTKLITLIAAVALAGIAQGEQPTTAPSGMRWIPAGIFAMGSDAPDARADESPVHKVEVAGFWIDETEVTNEQFAAFVEATHYVTTAERVPDVAAIMKQLPPGTPPPPKENLVPASMVFRQAVAGSTEASGWTWVPGADWRHPEGPGSDIAKRGDHPVVQVSWDDAVAYATWAGKRLPSEAEWEYAARGGLNGKAYAWGDEAPNDDAKPGRCNIWQGHFPDKNTAADGYVATCPVRAFPANGYGLFGVAGNVWEWCTDAYRADAYAAGSTAVPAADAPLMRVLRGGSFLCHASYCSSYRVAARMSSTPDSSMNHVGFRCVKSATPTTRPS